MNHFDLIPRRCHAGLMVICKLNLSVIFLWSNKTKTKTKTELVVKRKLRDRSGCTYLTFVDP